RLVNPGLVPTLVRGNFDAVLFMTGWAWLSAWIGFAACRVARIPIFLYGDSSYVPDEKSVRAKLRAAVMRALFGMTSAFMISGKLNGDYYKHYRADPRRFFPLPWAIDNERFVEGSAFAPGERDAMRERYGIAHDELAVIYSGKLIERKDPMTLLRALARDAEMRARMAQRSREIIATWSYAEGVDGVAAALKSIAGGEQT